MAINKNHEFEELEGVKCAIVEKNARQERVDFLKELLELNKYRVIVVASPPPKAATPPPAPVAAAATPGTEAVEAPAPPPPPPTPPTPVAPSTFTIGVTDVSFNPINAIFGRLLKTKEGNVVSLAYWQQKETIANDEIPYYANPASIKK